MRICVLDDVERVALAVADWESLRADEVVALEDHVADADALVAVLQRFDVLVVQRERTTLPRSVIEALPELRLVVKRLLLGIILLGFLYDTLKIGFVPGEAAKGFIPSFDGGDSVLLACGLVATG